MTRLGDALRRKFRTPQDALRALGLDPATLAMDARRPSRDAEGDPDDAFAATKAFLKAKLSPEDYQGACELLDNWQPGAEDEPADLPSGGMPRPGGTTTPTRPSAMDARYQGSGAFFSRFPHAARLSVLPSERPAHPRVAADQRRDYRDGDSGDSVAKRFPGAGRIKVL
jgi:hypothetical protein